MVCIVLFFMLGLHCVVSIMSLFLCGFDACFALHVFIQLVLSLALMLGLCCFFTAFVLCVAFILGFCFPFFS